MSIFYETLEKAASVRIIRALHDAMDGAKPSKKTLSLLRKRGIIDAADDLDTIRSKVQKRMGGMQTDASKARKRMNDAMEIDADSVAEDKLDTLITKTRGAIGEKKKLGEEIPEDLNKKLEVLKKRRRQRRMMERGQDPSQDFIAGSQGDKLNRARRYTTEQTDTLRSRTNQSKAEAYTDVHSRAQNLDNYITADMSNKQIEDRMTSLIGRTAKRGAERKEALEDLRYTLQEQLDDPKTREEFISNFSNAQRGQTGSGGIRTKAEFSRLRRKNNNLDYMDYDAARGSGQNPADAATTALNKHKNRMESMNRKVEESAKKRKLLTETQQAEPKPEVVGTKVEPKSVPKPEPKPEVVGTKVEPKPTLRVSNNSAGDLRSLSTPIDSGPKKYTSSVKADTPTPQVVGTKVEPTPAPQANGKKGINPLVLGGGALGIGALTTAGIMAHRNRRKKSDEQRQSAV